MFELYRAFLLFLPRSSFVYYLRFHLAFLECRVEHTGLLQTFTQLVFSKMKEKHKEEELQDAIWSKGLAEAIIDDLLFTCPTDYERGGLLQTVVKSSLHSKYTQLWETFQLLTGKANLSSELLFSSSPPMLVSLLIEKGFFEEARQLSKINALSPHLVTISEAKTVVDRYHKTSGQAEQCFRSQEKEMRRINLWNRCHSLLLRHQCEPKLAGEFFIGNAKNISKSSNLNSLCLCSKEYVTLLNFALFWYQQISPSPKELIKDLDSRIKLLSVGEELIESLAPLLMKIPFGVKLSDATSDSDILSNSSEGVNAELIDQALRKLLTTGSITQAELLCSLLNYDSWEIQIFKAFIGVAQGTLPRSQLPNMIGQYLLKQNPQINLKTISKIELLQSIASCLPVFYEFCQEILNDVQIATALDIEFQTLRTKPPYEVVRVLLMRGTSTFVLLQNFIHYKNLDPLTVANLIGEIYFNETLKVSAGEASPMGEIGKSDFMALVNLTLCPLEVGNKLVTLLLKNFHDVPHECQVELLIRAHACYFCSCSQEGCDVVLRIVAECHKQYEKEGEFKLLVRLLTGINKYNQMDYIITSLIHHDQFELLMSRNTKLNTEEQMELCIALRKYLAAHPSDRTAEKMEIVFLFWHMWNEMGELLIQKSEKALKELTDRPLTEETARRLCKVVQYFLDASNYFLEDKSFEASKKCIFRASLISLQLQKPTIQLLDLQPHQAKQLMINSTAFTEALIIANDYELNNTLNWAEALLKQVVFNGNFAYLEEFIRTLQCENDLFVQVAQLAKRTPIPPNRIENVKKLLMYLPVAPLRYQLLLDLGFSSFMSSFEKELYYCNEDQIPNNQTPFTTHAMSLPATQKTRLSTAMAIRSDTLPALNIGKEIHSFDLPTLFKMRTGNSKNTPNF